MRKLLVWGSSASRLDGLSDCPVAADARDVIEAIQRGRPGRSATRKYRAYSRAWRRRVFGRRASAYFWTIYFLLAVGVAEWHPRGYVTLWVGVLLGGAGAMWILLPDALGPPGIISWQLGAWGEQNTASELRPLQREGWTIAHDVRWTDRANHDHVVAGPAVYVLNSKNAKNSRVEVDGGVIRLTQIDTGDSYVAEKWLPLIEAEARAVKRAVDDAAGFPVAVYPVLVVWGACERTQEYIGDVALVEGDVVAEFLRGRPVDLLSREKRDAVAVAVRTLPRA